MNLNETQKFDFDYFKDRIKKYISYTLDPKQPISEEAIKNQFKNTFYSIIRNDTQGRLNAHKKLGFSDSQVNDWKTFFTSDKWIRSGPWSQRSFNSNLERKSGKDKTYNYYITFDKTKDNILNFFNSIKILDKELRSLSDYEKSPISYKTHSHLDHMVEDNDSLKIFYYDISLKLKIESLVKKWATDNKIIISPRSHTHGVDVRYNPNDDKNSFGELVSKEIAELFVKTIKTNGRKYTDDQYFNWIKKHFFDLLSNVKIN